MSGGTRPLHIVYVIPYFAPAWGYGGPPRVMYDAARRLARRGQRITVLTTDALDGERRVTPRQANFDGIAVRYLPNVSNRLAWRVKIFLPLGFRSALEQVVPVADVIHLSDFRSVQNAIAWRVATAAGVPYVLSAYGQLSRGRGMKRPMKVLFDHRDGYQLIRNAHALLAQTDHEVEGYRRLKGLASQTRLVPLAVDLEEFASPPPRGTFRCKYGIADDEVMLLFVGRFHEYKGLELLVRTFATLVAAHPNLRLVLVGRDDGYLPTLERLIDEYNLWDRVVLPGPIYGPERLAVYVDADIFAFSPSYYEETSTASLEALACGTPVVTTEQSSIPWLEEYGAGFEVPYDSAAFGAALERCLDVAARREMSVCARRLVEERFSWDNVTDLLEGIYEEARVDRRSSAKAGVGT